MAGQALSELKLRSRYRVSVFIVKERDAQQEPRFVTPSAAYTFRAGDTVLLSGAEKDIQALIDNI